MVSLSRLAKDSFNCALAFRRFLSSMEWSLGGGRKSSRTPVVPGPAGLHLGIVTALVCIHSENRGSRRLGLMHSSAVARLTSSNRQVAAARTEHKRLSLPARHCVLSRGKPRISRRFKQCRNALGLRALASEKCNE